MQRGGALATPRHCVVPRCQLGAAAPREPAPALSRREALLLSSLAALAAPGAAARTAAPPPAAAARTVLVGGTRVAAVGAGTWQFGNQLLWGYETSQDEGLRAAFEELVGGDAAVLFDTADSCAAASPARVQRHDAR
jgi:hypothetical protein